LRPTKNRAGNRVYRRKEIKLIHLLQHLLYNEKYTIEGARHKLDQLRKEGKLARAARVAWEAETVRQLRREADALVELLDT
jgi:DNA-binding transcriptional MerR regulator